MQNKELSAGTKDEKRTTAESCTSASLVQNGVLAEEGNLKNDSPYCRLCDSCGIEGCCDFIQCFSQLIKNDNCDFGESYLRDARFSFRTSQLADEVINNLENGLYDSKLAVEQYRKGWNDIYDEVYKADD
jgi:hypothetical protein